jgi:FkbM family methyltransferase
LPSRSSRSDVIVDVGASRGQFALDAARANQCMRVLAFEPLEAPRTDLTRRAEEMGLSNLRVLPWALGAHSGKATMQVTEGLGEVSSIYEIHGGYDPYWSQRNDIEVVGHEVVVVRTLEDVLDEEGVDEVRFLKVDAQGADIEVLRGLGHLAPRVNGGMLEVAATRSTSLYPESGATLEAVFPALSALGFDVSHLKPNDHACSEVNVFFVRRGSRWGDVAATIHSDVIPLIHSTDYWDLPGPAWGNSAAELESLRHEIGRAHQVITDLSARSAAVAAEAVELRAAVELVAADGQALCARTAEERDAARAALEDVRLAAEGLAASRAWRVTQRLRRLFGKAGAADDAERRITAARQLSRDQ